MITASDIAWFRRSPQLVEHNRRTVLALHEAGHALVAALQRVPIEFVTIDREKAQENAVHDLPVAGCVYAPARGEILRPIEERWMRGEPLTPADKDTLFCAALINVAGGAAEAEVFGRVQAFEDGNTGTDHTHAHTYVYRLLGKPFRPDALGDEYFLSQDYHDVQGFISTQVWPVACQVISEHLAEIDLVAKLLMHRRTLTGPEITEILTLSVAAQEV